MRRGLPAVLFLLLTLFAGGSAVALNLAIGRMVEVPEATARRPSVAARDVEPDGRPARALTADQYLDGIMGRNLFDVAIIDLWAARRPSASGDSVALTELRVKLLGVIVADPEVYSSALIADEDSTELPRAYSIGDILHAREVVSIEKQRVGLKKEDGTIEYVTMDGALVRSTASSEPSSDDGADSGEVREVADGKYEVSKETFDKNINDLEGISRMGRALLHRGPDGEFDGYRLSAIRRGTLADQLGIKNGDIIHSVNGEPLNSVQSAMNAYNTMKSQSNFCFEISRRGSPQQLCYDVR